MGANIAHLGGPKLGHAPATTGSVGHYPINGGWSSFSDEWSTCSISNGCRWLLCMRGKESQVGVKLEGNQESPLVNLMGQAHLFEEWQWINKR